MGWSEWKNLCGTDLSLLYSNSGSKTEIGTLTIPYSYTFTEDTDCIIVVSQGGRITGRHNPSISLVTTNENNVLFEKNVVTEYTYDQVKVFQYSAKEGESINVNTSVENVGDIYCSMNSQIAILKFQ